MENTSKNFVLQLGSLVSLYISLGALIALVFGVINIAFPDAVSGYWQYESAQNSIRFGIAMLIVFFPTYIILTRLVNTIRRTEHGVYLTLTRWLIYLSLFVGSMILLGDLVAVILTFLNGEISTRFTLKALTLLAVIGAALYYYILDARGYWNTHESYSKLFGLGASVMVVAVILLGFFYIDTPAQVRDARLDQQQVSDLQDIQWRVADYFRANEKLPASIDELYIESTIPTSPEDRPAYEYQILDETTFELCATFAHTSTREIGIQYPRPMYDDSIIQFSNNWEHEAGEFCFERTATPNNIKN
ncbi:MAG: DUF5671 domain-containing protein [Candidatus Paceibacterota bacterium]